MNMNLPRVAANQISAGTGVTDLAILTQSVDTLFADCRGQAVPADASSTPVIAAIPAIDASTTASD
jgi:hypothetical protein